MEKIPLTSEEIKEYVEAFRSLLEDGIKAPVKMTFRAAPRRLVPASEWETIETELHSVGDLGDEVIWLYTQAHNTPVARGMNLSAFPSPRIEYTDIQVQPFRNAMALMQKRLREEPVVEERDRQTKHQSQNKAYCQPSHSRQSKLEIR